MEREIPATNKQLKHRKVNPKLAKKNNIYEVPKGHRGKVKTASDQLGKVQTGGANVDSQDPANPLIAGHNVP